MKTFRILLVASTALRTANFALAQTWTQTSAPITNWTAVACSADGSKLIVAANGGYGANYTILPGPIYISTNSGATWTQASNAPDAAWRSVASSADGNKLIAAVNGGGIYRSVDLGLTWTQTSAPNTNWVSVASSADANILAAVAGIFPPPDFYTSGDSGNTWTAKASPYDRWFAIASSADGNKLVACGGLGTILASTNSGSSWTTNVIVGGVSSSVASSADGNRLVVAGSVAGSGKIYLSTNSGLAWTQINTPFFSRVSSSADGSKLVAAGSSAIYVSTDFGATWVTNILAGATSVASSADGNKLAAVVNGGGIWTCQTTPTPQLNIAPTNPGLKLSWIVPSANFVLQQSADLVSWEDMTNPPALNLTNLQDEIILSPTNSSGFYRLKTP